MGHVVVKYKVTINQPDEGNPDYDGIAGQIDGFEEVQAVEIKPLAFGMMFIEVQAVLGEGEGIVDELRARQAACSGAGLHARIHLLPSALAGVAGRLRERGAHLVVYPEPAVVHARFEPEAGSSGPGWCEGVLGLLGEIRNAGSAEVVIEAMPGEASGERDVFAGAGGLDLMRAIKRRFDPEAILNPGRFAGRI